MKQKNILELPMVSIVIPVYNAEKTIERCLNSVFQQTYSNIEIICINDGSEDHSLELLQKNNKLITILDQENGGAPKSRNKGLQIAKGKYIQFLDADDELLPDKIERHILLFNLYNNNYGFLAAGYKRILINGEEKKYKPQKDIWEGMLKTLLGITSANLFRTDWVKKVSGWDEELKSHQEGDLMLRILQNGADVIIDETISSIVYSTKGSISTSKKPFKDHNFHRGLKYRAKIIEYLASINEVDKKYIEIKDQRNFVTLKNLFVEFPEKRTEIINIYKTIIPNDFIPTSEYNKQSFVILFKFFGFKRAMIAKLWIKKLYPFH